LPIIWLVINDNPPAPGSVARQDAPVAAPERRRSRVVDAPRQARMVLHLTALPMGVMLVAAIVMWFLVRNLFDEAEAGNADLPSLGPLVMTQFVFVVVAGAIAVWQAWRHSHRVVGPANRIASLLRRLRSGDTGFRVELRSGDELQEVADELNELIETLEQTTGQRKAGAAPGAGPSGATSGATGGAPAATTSGVAEAAVTTHAD
jgi:methyl-accepting chemotaxis protein